METGFKFVNFCGLVFRKHGVRFRSATLSLTLPDLNLTIFPSIPCLVSGRRSEPVIILLENRYLTFSAGSAHP